MEDLQLPDDARTIWERGAETVIETLRRYRCTPSMGGGSLLAARWNGHRRSFDIDFRTKTREGHRLLRAARDPATIARMREAGGRSEGIATNEGAIWRVTFPETGVGSTQQRIEIWARTATPEGGETAGRINGHHILLQSTAQVLRGKLQRTGALAARDVFDVKLAGMRDRRALAIAVNTLADDDFERRMQVWLDGHIVLANRAPRQISEASPEEQKTWDTLAHDAVAGCRAARYRTVHLSAQPHVLRFEYTTRDGHTGEHLVKTDAVHADTVRHGVWDWLEANGHDIDELIGRSAAPAASRERIPLLEAREDGATRAGHAKAENPHPVRGGNLAVGGDPKQGGKHRRTPDRASRNRRR